MRKTLAGLVLLTCVAGCNGDPASVSVSQTSKQAFLALTAASPDLANAEQELTRRCLVRAGFPDVPRSTSSAVDTDLLGYPARLSASQVSVSGYGSSIRRDPSSSTDPQGSYLESLPSDRRAAYEVASVGGIADTSRVTLPDGTIVEAPKSGCVAQARTTLYGNVQQFLLVAYLPQTALKEVNGVSDADELKAVRSAYKACMKERGLEVGNWQDGVKQAQEIYERAPSPDGRVSGQEILIAVADATCRDKTGLVAAYDRVVQDRAVRWLASNETQVLAAAEARRAAEKRAVAALSSGS
ncbi:MAG TPA: hypothetical protein VM097_05020 [Mycobacteriales bacterium]|nr:hypothetical protein [Mycobacteriales bacterium]